MANIKQCIKKNVTNYEKTKSKRVSLYSSLGVKFVLQGSKYTITIQLIVYELHIKNILDDDI